MWQDEDTQTAFKDKHEANMRIQDDTHRAFGDPAEKDSKMRIQEDPDVRDQFLLEYREMLGEGDGRSDNKNMLVEGLPRVPSGKDPPVLWKTNLQNPSNMTDEYYVRCFLHNSAQLDADIVDLIVKEGGVTKLEVFEYLTVEDLLGWGIPKVKARYLIQKDVPRMLKELQKLHDQDISIPPHAVSMLHVDAPVVINSPAHVHANDDEHMLFHDNSLHSNATRESVNPSGPSPTITRGTPAGLQEATSATRLSSWTAQGPPARSTGLTPDRQVDRIPQFEVCHNCRTQDSTVRPCRIDAQTLMKLCKPCANMVNTVYGRNSSSSSSDGASVSTRSSQREDDEVEDQGPSSPQCMRVTDLTGLGSGYRSSGAPSAFVAAIQKQAPSMEGDKQGRILANGPKFEHYMDMIPLLARQFDDLPGGDPTGGTCLARVLRYSQQHPAIQALPPRASL